METTHGTEAAANHSANRFSNKIPCACAICMHRKFCAAAERSRAARDVPALQLLPHQSARALVQRVDDGGETPAALAVVDGIAGDSTASAVCSPYASRSVVCPNALTKSSPSRSPNPVLMNARAKNVATTMSQMTSLVSAARPSWNVTRFAATVNVSAMNAHAPTGAGFATRPVTVLAKMAKSVHARGVSAWHGAREPHREADAHGEGHHAVVDVVRVDRARMNPRRLRRHAGGGGALLGRVVGVVARGERAKRVGSRGERVTAADARPPIAPSDASARVARRWRFGAKRTAATTRRGPTTRRLRASVDPSLGICSSRANPGDAEARVRIDASSSRTP